MVSYTKIYSVASDVLEYASKEVKSVRHSIKKEAKGVFQETSIGRKIVQGMEDARSSFKNKMHSLEEDTSSTFAKFKSHLQRKGASTYKNLKEDKEFMDIYEQYVQKRGLKDLNFPDDMPADKAFQVLIESSGVGPTKLAQIISSNEKYMSQIKNPDLVKAIQGTRSNCSFSRSLEEAEEVLTKAFPGAGYHIQKELSAGSIGAAYLIKRPDGSTAVLKMLKKGVDKESLELEEKISQRLIKELSDNPEETEQIQKTLSQYYKDWIKELDFRDEMKYNQMLTKGAKRYKVAQVTDLSSDHKCLVMDLAGGVQMNKLVKMLKDFLDNPNEYATKYAKEIQANPWLGKPEKVIKDLPETLLKTFDEQFMFLKKGGKSVMHGDPHTGNFFIGVDKKGHLVPEFIDTGNCVTRTSAQVKNDIQFFTNYFVGNSDGVAKYFVNLCEYKGPEKDKIIELVSKDINNLIFNQKHNITDFEKVQSNISVILEKYGLKMSTENATAMKAQMQFFTAIAEAGKLTGNPSVDIFTLIKDIPHAAYDMIKTGTNPWSSIKEAIKYARHNVQASVGTAGQFTLKDITANAQEVNNFSRLA